MATPVAVSSWGGQDADDAVAPGALLYASLHTHSAPVCVCGCSHTFPQCSCRCDAHDAPPRKVLEWLAGQKAVLREHMVAKGSEGSHEGSSAALGCVWCPDLSSPPAESGTGVQSPPRAAHGPSERAHVQDTPARARSLQETPRETRHGASCLDPTEVDIGKPDEGEGHMFAQVAAVAGPSCRVSGFPEASTCARSVSGRQSDGGLSRVSPDCSVASRLDRTVSSHEMQRSSGATSPWQRDKSSRLAALQTSEKIERLEMQIERAKLERERDAAKIDEAHRELLRKERAIASLTDRVQRADARNVGLLAFQVEAETLRRRLEEEEAQNATAAAELTAQRGRVLELESELGELRRACVVAAQERRVAEMAAAIEAKRRTDADREAERQRQAQRKMSQKREVELATLSRALAIELSVERHRQSGHADSAGVSLGEGAAQANADGKGDGAEEDAGNPLGRQDDSAVAGEGDRGAGLGDVGNTDAVAERGADDARACHRHLRGLSENHEALHALLCAGTRGMVSDSGLRADTEAVASIGRAFCGWRLAVRAAWARRQRLLMLRRQRGFRRMNDAMSIWEALARGRAELRRQADQLWYQRGARCQGGVFAAWVALRRAGWVEWRQRSAVEMTRIGRLLQLRTISLCQVQRDAFDRWHATRTAHRGRKRQPPGTAQKLRAADTWCGCPARSRSRHESSRGGADSSVFVRAGAGATANVGGESRTPLSSPEEEEVVVSSVSPPSSARAGLVTRALVRAAGVCSDGRKEGSGGDERWRRVVYGMGSGFWVWLGVMLLSVAVRVAEDRRKRRPWPTRGKWRKWLALGCWGVVVVLLRRRIPEIRALIWRGTRERSLADF